MARDAPCRVTFATFSSLETRVASRTRLPIIATDRLPPAGAFRLRADTWIGGKASAACNDLAQFSAKALGVVPASFAPSTVATAQYFSPTRSRYSLPAGETFTPP